MFNRFRMVGLAAVTALTTLHAVPALSNVQTWDFNSSSQNIAGTSWGSSLSMSEDGINLTVTGWADTSQVTGADRIEDARLRWAQPTALGIQNRDESNNSPNHAVDSSAVNNGGSAYDMLLLEFDTAVDLDAINLTWAWEGGSTGSADVSILAWDGTSDPGLLNKRWSQVLDSNGGAYSSAGNHSNVGMNTYYGVNSTNVASSKWLIGVYNPVFGENWSSGNDAFKLSAIRTSTPNPPSDVPVPGTLALFMAGMLAMRTRKVRRAS